MSTAIQFTAQNGEDRWMWEHRVELCLPPYGVYVEVGAADGLKFSNTWWLEQLGWKGLCIEPDQRFEPRLSLNRKCLIEHCAIGKEYGTASLRLMSDPTLSGLVRPGFPRVNVLVVTLDHLLRKHALESVHVLSIDTEGTELDVWNSFDHSKVRPNVVVLEWLTRGLVEHSERVIQALRSSEYELAVTLGANHIFVPSNQRIG